MNSGLEKATGLVAEFKAFIARGNVMDLAVGVIIGGAFKTIIDSLVADVIMPFVGIFIGKDSFSALSFSIGGATILMGHFIEAVVNFLIMAVIVFLLVKFLNSFQRKKSQVPPPPPAPSKEEILLTEIRDLLKEK